MTINDEERGPLLHGNGSAQNKDAVGEDDASVRDGASIPVKTWQSEYRLILIYSIPLVATYLLQYSAQLIAVVSSARLSTDELAGVSLGITTSNIIGYAIFEGMATALDTLCSQAYGAGNHSMVGLLTVRFTILVQLVAIPIGVLWIFSPQILGALVPSRALAQDAGEFLRWTLIGVPGYASFEAGKRYFQSQGNFTAGFMVLVICAPVNLVLNWLLVFHLGLRISGVALAAALTNLLRPVLLCGYALLVNRSTLKCWQNPLNSGQVFKNWGSMSRLAFPGVLMVMSEWLSLEILTFSTSYVSSAQLAAQTFASTGGILVWHIPFSASVAIGTRIGQLVGGGHIDSARKVTAWYAWMFLAIGVLDVGLFFGINEIMMHYLSTNKVVRDLVAGAMPYVAIFVFFDSTSSWIHGVIRGLGWQSIGAWCTMTVNYLFAVPLALYLELGDPDMGIRGLWLSLGIALALITVIESLVTKARSWNGCVIETQEEPEDS